MAKKTEMTDADQPAASAMPIPRLGFPVARSRPTSIIDTTPAVDITTEGTLSASSSSSLQSSGASPRKHTQSLVDRLSATMQIDDAAVAKNQRNRTTSSTSRSSHDGSPKTKLPSLMKTTAILTPSNPTISTSTQSEADAPPSEILQEEDSMSRKTSDEKPTSVHKSPAKPSTLKHTPDAPPLVALLSDSKVSKLIKQGAEAKVFVSTIITNDVLSWPQRNSSSMTSHNIEPPAPVLLKWRFPKTYRHPTLSRNITASRTLMEARALLRCAKAGVAVPSVRCVDEKEGILGLELVPGRSVREWLGGGAEGEDEDLIEPSDAHEDDEEVLSESDQVQMMKLIGRQLAIMHEADIIHGDLTTSNMMLRMESDASRKDATVDLQKGEIVLIDFGLSSVSAFAEDKAVDLYVLERAFASTHPASESLFQTVLTTYAEEVTKRSSGKNRGKGGRLDKWEETRRKLDEVRLRGRKRSMVGSALFKQNKTTRIVVNFELSLSVEARGIMTAIKTTPALIGALLGMRPQHLLQHVPAVRRSQAKKELQSSQWHQLASRMDKELDHIGSTRLLASHTAHESYALQDPTSRQSWLSVSIVPFKSVSLPKLPLLGFAERFAVAGLEKTWNFCSRVGPAFPSSQYARLGLRDQHGKAKAD